MNVVLKYIIRVWAPFGIDFGVFFDEEKELIFEFALDLWICDELMDHFGKKLMGSVADAIAVDVDGFDEVLGEGDEIVFAFAGQKEVLDFAEGSMVV